MTNRIRGFFFVLLFSMGMAAGAAERTAFQTASPWMPELDLRSDVAIVYGVNESFPERVAGWRGRGYGIHMMTGVAWGGYQDYLDGRFDGTDHWHEGQVQRNGEMIMHGARVPYMVPTKPYVEYLKSLVKRAIDEGATAIHLEEPEFWNRGGYSEGFKGEWREMYGEDWQAQHESPEAAYRSARLKYRLYFRALREIFQFAKDYSEERGERVKCFVPTHTLINYSAWGIVSPESSLADLPGMDGYIAQVWTGTARTPVIYNGVERERTFENAFLEYGSMTAMTRPTGRTVYFLTDPIEDNPGYTWENYKKNYEDTFTAQLLHGSVNHYEVMPWPNRIFRGKYRVEGATERMPIPADYATEILTLINALNHMEVVDEPVGATPGIGVLLSDTLMFQRFPVFGEEDRRMSNFYGMALPLLKHGVAPQLVQMENLPFEDTLKDIRVLLMTYANMKPLKPEYHNILAEWVRNGGALIYLCEDNDPYQTIREWWNEEGAEYGAPSRHLFEQLGIESAEDGLNQPVGEGFVMVRRINPKTIAEDPAGGGKLRGWAREALAKAAPEAEWNESNHLRLRRGNYEIAAVLEESVSDRPLTLRGPLIDLYDPELTVLLQKIVHPGGRAFVYSMRGGGGREPGVLAGAARASEEVRGEGVYECTLKGPANTQNVTRIWLPSSPVSVSLTEADGGAIDFGHDWDSFSQTLRLRHPNRPDGARVSVKYPVRGEG